MSVNESTRFIDSKIGCLAPQATQFAISHRHILYRIVASLGLQDLKSFVDVLLRLELVVVNILHDPLPVDDISLAPRECSEEVRGDTPFFPQLVSLVTE